ncbi:MULTISPECIES: glutaredoxin family protein [Pseudoalteromonas]|uniref:NrdH-redoxin n=1 Tax=Pseudoalteromonas amylolytica TaxID=1859457 RepID=A0A1S1MYZ4_9GAMM|nr:MULTISPECIES: glutaredoxin family protein [Pseudoalteromonas]MCF6434142.1 glutaredoxin family protein [Pseudoalteromonas sp. MMG022]OHU87954.1 NrdH-redoxin [Pseudoalteromonas sp. JW3]OHU91394.1 NrdH-redoxin [Pseudoalteromonas amylolytica]
MAKYILYFTQGCHLCEQAHELAIQILNESDIEHVDIVDDTVLMEAYQTSIPVIKRTRDGQTLYWPFELEQIQQLAE